MKNNPASHVNLLASETSFRKVLAIGLVVMGVALGLFGPALFQGRLPVARAACSGQNLYLGSYYLLPDDGSHPDFEQVLQQLVDVPGQLQPALVNGLPVPVNPNPPLSDGAPTNTSIRQFDWYTPQYQIFTRMDNNPLAFSNNGTPGTTPYFGPSTQPAPSAALPANKDLFTVHWHANLFAPPGGLTIPYSFALDDAGWVFLDGQLQIDHGGIHPPATFTGNFVIPAGQHTVDIFFADRHTVDAVTNFQLGNLGALIDCGSPNLSLVKSVQPPGIVNPGDYITYTVQVSNSGNYTATNTIIRDTTPANTAFVSASPAPISGPPVGGSGEVVWNVGTLLPGQSKTLTFVVRVNPNTPPAIAISNAALGTSNESGGVIFRSNGVSNIVNATAALAVNKTANPPGGSNVNIGDNVTYSITVNNFGNVPTGSVVVQDPLPAGTSFVAANPAAQSVQNNLVRWVLPPIPANGSVTLSLTVKVISRPPSGVMQNQASASSSGLTAGSPLVTHNINQASDTGVNKLVQGAIPPFPAPPAPIPVGTLITYQLVGTNAGPSTAVGVVMTDTLPTGVSFVSSVPPVTTQAANLLTWNLGDLTAGQTVNIFYTVQVTTAGVSFSNSAGIRSNTPELNPGNNTATADVPGGAAPVDVQVVKSGPPTVAPGQVFIYTLTVSTVNGGDNIVVTDTLQTGLTLVPDQSSPPPIANGQTLTWNLGHMDPGTTRIILLAVRATGVTSGTSITNSAQVSGGTGPTRSVNNSNSTNTNVANGANLSISKAAVTTDFTPGQPLGFVITVKNNAPTASGGMTVTDTLLPGITLQTSTPPLNGSQVNPDGSTTLFWRILTVPGNGQAQINFTVLIPANYSGPTVSNSASLNTDTPNLDPTITTDPVVVPKLGLLADLALTKDSLTTALRPGQAFAYTITVKNNGIIEARDVTVQDALPTGLTFLSSQPAPSASNPLTWKLGNLSPGGQASITLLVQLSQNFTGNSISNSASVTTVSGDSNQGNNTVIKSIPINAPPASATPAITRIPNQPVDTPTPGPTRTPVPAGTTAVAGTTTPAATLVATATITASATATVVATTAAAITVATVTPSVAGPGLPNTGQAVVGAAGDGLPLSLVLGLLLIGLGLWLWLPRRQRRP